MLAHMAIDVIAQVTIEQLAVVANPVGEIAMLAIAVVTMIFALLAHV